MSKSFNIRYLSTAERDLEDIFKYIKKDKPGAAATMLERFDQSISLLAKNPFIGLTPKNERLKKMGYRMLVIDNYIVFYIAKKTTVQIRRIIHGARQYSFLL